MTDTSTAASPPARTRLGGRGWLVLAAVAVVIVLASLKTFASIWTDQMWFSASGIGGVWTELFRVKVGLILIFGAIFFVLMFSSLMVSDSVGRRLETPTPDDDFTEFVQSIQERFRHRATQIFAAISLLFAAVAGASTMGQWATWLGYIHGASVGTVDPVFHRDLSYYLFTLPFYEFVLSWWITSLVVVTLITVLHYYLNGGIRPRTSGGWIQRPVKVHLSILLALIALSKAVGYSLQPGTLLSHQTGYVEGIACTDAHARIPAIHLLFLVSLAAAVILLVNIRRRGWVLPAIAVSMWFVVAIVIGLIYPAILQAVRVTPDQGKAEAPYIARNLDATRAAYGLNGIKVQQIAGTGTPSSKDVATSAQSLANIRLWDPSDSVSLQTFQNNQALRSFYQFQSIGFDRYFVKNELTPVDIGARELSTDLVNQTWVNAHLQYTHGSGVVVAAANQVTPDGYPVYGVSNVPSTSLPGYPTITQPGIYFGVGQSGFVVANTKQLEQDYPLSNGANVENHYASSGGVPVGGLLSRAAFAIRLWDANFLISGQITSKSRVLFVRNPVSMAQKAAPFLTIDSQPYAVAVDGHVDWMLDGYTTTSTYPYAQDPAKENVLIPSGSNLQGGFNYVRDSVKIVVDAYSGKMTFYAWDPSDPLLKVYESAFPKMFTPAADMPSELLAHVRYPNDLFALQAAMYGKYHITSPSGFYSASDAWNLSPTPGVGAYSAVTQSNSVALSGQADRMAPLYQVAALPSQATQRFLATEAFVPSSQGDQSHNLTALMMVDSDPGPNYGQISSYTTPRNQSVPGPQQASNAMLSFTKASEQLSLLDKGGSSVVLSNLLMVPVGKSVLYVRPVYVTSSSNNIPLLRDILTDMNGNIGFESTLSAAVSDAIGSSVPINTGGGGSGGGSTHATVTSLLAQANVAFAQAQAALRAGNLAVYQADMNKVGVLIGQAAREATAAKR